MGGAQLSVGAWAFLLCIFVGGFGTALLREKAMDIVAPLVSTGHVSETLNLWLAVPIGFIFGFGLYHAGFTDSRRIARARST